MPAQRFRNRAAQRLSGTSIKRGTRRAFYCQCGRDKIIANGYCATCYTLRRQDERHFRGFGSGLLSGTATPAGAVAPPDGTSDRLWFITAGRDDRGWI